MKIAPTPMDGLVVIEPQVFGDERGYFFESYNQRDLNSEALNLVFVQDNQSRSKKNVIRGLHFQVEPHAQTKLIRVLQGSILDVVVDLRRQKPTFGKSYSIELSADNKLQLLIPKGFAHGFSVLSDTAEILYKCDDFYYPEFERGILYNDPDLAIDWKVKKAEEVVSARDMKLSPLSQSKDYF